MPVWKLTSKEWKALKTLLVVQAEQSKRRGRRPLPDLKPVVEACLYHHYHPKAPRYHSTGWHQFPQSLGVAPSTANRYFRRWTDDGSWQSFCAALADRRGEGLGCSQPICSPIISLVKELERAYSFFNHRLFGNELPSDTLITIEAKYENSYFRSHGDRGHGPHFHLIAISMHAFRGRPADVCGSLLHEMVHLHVHTVGLASGVSLWHRHYHNMIFRDAAIRAGLHCEPRDEGEGYGFTQLGEEGRKAVEKLTPKPILAKEFGLK